MPSLSASRATPAAGAAGTSSGTNPSHGRVHAWTAAPSTFRLSRNLRTDSSSPGEREEPDQVSTAKLGEAPKLRKLVL